MKRSAICWGAMAALTVGVVTTATARPQYLQAFKAHYNTASGKPTLNGANCALCHVGPPAQAKWNVYGEAVRAALGAQNVTDRAKIEAALVAAEKKTNPATMQTFAALIAGDKFPGSNMAAGGGAAGGAGTGGAPVNTGTWEPAFNGVNMDGLTKMNAGNWSVQNFLLHYTGGGNGWLRTNKQYKNYSAVIVWRFPEGGNRDSGIFLKATSLEGNPWPNSPQLNMGPGENIGSISGTQGTRNRYDLIKPNDWNTFQITVWNGIATLAINGQVAWEQSSGGIPDQPGYIGIECEGAKIDIAQFWVYPMP